MYKNKFLLIATILISPMLAFAESELSVYGGVQGSPHSTVENTKTGIPFYTGWKGASLDFPIYIGFRYTNWIDDDWGYAINYTHTKAISTDQGGPNDLNGYTRLQFTDGANPLTAIALKRFAYRDIKPYIGVGLGISVPHPEIKWGSSAYTFNYQYGGPVATAVAGFSYPYNEKWSLFTDFQMHYMKLNVAIDGGRLKTNLITNALNFGVSYCF